MDSPGLTICILLATLLTGCAALPEESPESAGAEHPDSLGISQAPGEPPRFLVCGDCPTPTQKTVLGRSAPRGKKPTQDTPPPTPSRLLVHFEPASSMLKRADRDAIARLVKGLPGSYRLTITGYTDSTANGGIISNEALAKDRAQAVADRLNRLGVKPADYVLKASPLCCYIAPNTHESGRAKNRRAEILVTPTSQEGNQP